MAGKDSYLQRGHMECSSHCQPLPVALLVYAYVICSNSNSISNTITSSICFVTWSWERSFFQLQIEVLYRVQRRAQPSECELYIWHMLLVLVDVGPNSTSINSRSFPIMHMFRIRTTMSNKLTPMSRCRQYVHPQPRYRPQTTDSIQCIHTPTRSLQLHPEMQWHSHTSMGRTILQERTQPSRCSWFLKVQIRNMHSSPSV